MTDFIVRRMAQGAPLGRERRRLLAAGLGTALSACRLVDGPVGMANPPRATYSIDFRTAALEDPLSASGTWSNNTQGVGGNVAPMNMTSMRVGLASGDGTRIAMATHAGYHYDDSFAFVPGFGADQFIEGVVYREEGYNPNARGSNHELEFLLGCSSWAGGRCWNECLFNTGGGVDVVYLSGGPNDFNPIGNVDGRNRFLPRHGDLVRAEKTGNVISLYLNGVLKVRYDGADPSKVARGSGIGIGGFIRPGAVHNKYGFISVTMGTL